MIRCCCCLKAANHFTRVDEMGGYCDECVIAGKLKQFGITIPDVPGIPQKSRESVIPREFIAVPAVPR